MEQYLSFPTNTLFKTEEKKFVSLPAITICPTNFISARKLEAWTTLHFSSLDDLLLRAGRINATKYEFLRGVMLEISKLISYGGILSQERGEAFSLTQRDSLHGYSNM